MTPETPVLPSPTFGAHFDHYQKLRAIRMSPHSLRTERDVHLGFWKFLKREAFQGDELSVKREDLLRYSEYLFSRTDLKKNNAIHYMNMLKAFYIEAQNQGWIIETPYRKIEMPKYDFNLVKALTVKEMKTMLDLPDLSTAAGIHDRTLLELMYCCAIRRGDILSLTASSFAEDYQTVRLNGKGAKAACLPIGRVARHFVSFYTEELYPRLNTRKEKVLFLSLKTRKPLDKQSLLYIINRYAKQVRQEDLGTHFFRYSACTHLADEGVDIRVLQEYMRHESPGTTMRYIRQSIQRLQEVHRDTHPRS